LRGLTSLTQLRVDNACLTDEGLEYLAGMKKLNSLTLSGDFTGDGLRHVEGLKGLTYVRIISAGSLDSNAVELLKQKLPNLLEIQQEIRELPTFVTRLVEAGRILPGFEHIRIDFSAEEHTGRMILVCFFDVNQRPSRNCIMRLAKQAEELKQKGVTVVTVQASKIDGNKLDEWVKNYNIPFPVGMVQGDVEKSRFAWGVKSLPWLILTDQKHIVSSNGFALTELDEKLKQISGE